MPEIKYLGELESQKPKIEYLGGLESSAEIKYLGELEPSFMDKAKSAVSAFAGDVGEGYKQIFGTVETQALPETTTPNVSLQKAQGVSTRGISYNPPPIKDTRPKEPIIRAKQPIEDILSRKLTPEELANIGIQKETRLLKPTIETLAEAFTGGIVPYNVRPEVQAKHPIASFAGQIAGLIAAGELTAPVKYIGALFTKFPALKPLIENTLHGGATFGGKDLSDQIMEITGQDKGTAIDTKRLIFNTAIGMGFSAFASLPKAISDSIWYRKATIPERQLVVQTVGDLKKVGYSDAEIARMKPEFFKQEFEKRMVTERPISVPVKEPPVPPQKFTSPAEQTIATEQTAQMTFERAKDILKNKVTVTEAETKAAFDFLENKMSQLELYRAKKEGAKAVKPSDYINDVTLGELQNKAAKGEDVAAHLRAGLKDGTITKAQAEDAIGKIIQGP